MATLTRSASLTDIPEKDERGNQKSEGMMSKERNRGIDIYGSPQKTPRNFINRHSLASGVGAPPLNTWKWLSNPKVSNEDQSRSSQRGGMMYSATSTMPGSESSKGGEDNHSSSAGSLRKNRNDRLEAALPRYVDHLETLLPQFCLSLSHPTYQEAATAMSLLLNNPPAVPVVDSGISFSSFVPGSPADKKSQQRNRQSSSRDKEIRTSVKSLLSSPFRSRRPRQNKWQEDGNNSSRNWTPLSSLGTQSASSSANNSVHNPSLRTRASSFSDRLDAAAWQSFVAPLVLLAGAEAIYADLEHVHPTPSIIEWSGLYQRVYSELMATIPPLVDESPVVLHSPPSSPPAGGGSSLLPPGSKLDPPIFPDIRTTIASSEDHAPTTPKKTNKSQMQSNGGSSECKHIRSLLSWLELKCQWLPLHESLFLTWNPNNLALFRAFDASLPPVPTVQEGSQNQGMKNGPVCGRRLMAALRHEIQATLSLMEMGFCLERGRFLETVVYARRVKMHLETVSHKETALILWMKTTFQDYLSIMPLVFDKVHTFATPLYGFDQQILLDATQNERTFMNDRKGVIDLDNLVVDFLRRQEKAGGTSTAVAIVYDTEGLEDSEEANQSPNPNSALSGSRNPQNVHPHPRRIELGYAMHGNHKQNATGGIALSSRQSLGLQQDRGTKSSPPSDKEQKPKNSAEDRQWPAIYLRSTMRLSPQKSNVSSITGSGMGLISGMRRNPSSAARGSGINLDGSASSPHTSSKNSGLHLSQRSVDGSPRSKYRKSTSNKRCSLLSHGNVFEYETEPSNRPSWPHSEWGQLRTFLEMMDNGTWSTNLVTDRADDSQSSPRPQDSDAKAPHSFRDDEPMAVTFHPDGEEPNGEGAGGSSFSEPGSSIFSSDLGKQFWDPLPTASLPQVGNTSTAGTGPTTFHAVPLNSFMWMIVMVKGEEESRWRRKARGLADNEVRAFLNEMAPKLSISNRFLGLKTCQTARVKVKDRLAPRVRGRELGLRDAQWQSDNPEDDDQVQEDVLQLMKEAFSVSGASPMLNRAESILTTMSGGFRPSGSSRSPRDRRRVLALQQQSGPFANNSDYREGAAMLFLGPELMKQFLESTNE